MCGVRRCDSSLASKANSAGIIDDSDYRKRKSQLWSLTVIKAHLQLFCPCVVQHQKLSNCHRCFCLSGSSWCRDSKLRLSLSAIELIITSFETCDAYRRAIIESINQQNSQWTGFGSRVYRARPAPEFTCGSRRRNRSNWASYGQCSTSPGQYSRSTEPEKSSIKLWALYIQ